MSIFDSEHGIVPPPDDGIEEYFDLGLERSNTERAEKIALSVRQKGKRRFGEMWAEYNELLEDGRSVFLQASDSALVIHISGTGGGALNEHARWDRKRNIINTFEQRDPDRENIPIMYYQVAPRSERIPETLTRFEVSRKFAFMLGQIERESGKG